MTKTWLLKAKLFLLIHMYDSFSEYDISGTAWQKYYSPQDIEKIYSIAAINSERKAILSNRIIDTVRTLINSGIPIKDLTKDSTIREILYEELSINDTNNINESITKTVTR